MANLKSARKDIRRIAKRDLRNRQARSRLGTLRRNLDQAIAGGEDETIGWAIRSYVSGLDRAAKSGVIHRRKADRTKARCARLRK